MGIVGEEVSQEREEPVQVGIGGVEEKVDQEHKQVNVVRFCWADLTCQYSAPSAGHYHLCDVLIPGLFLFTQWVGRANGSLLQAVCVGSSALLQPGKDCGVHPPYMVQVRFDRAHLQES